MMGRLGVLLVLIVGCAGAPAATPTQALSPSPPATPPPATTASPAPTLGSPAPTATVEPLPTLTPGPSRTPGQTPTAIPTPAPTPVVTPTATAAPPAGWRHLADFPAQGATTIESVLAIPTGFVAIGTRFDERAACWNDAHQTRVWTSADGVSWTPRADEVFAQTRPWMMFEFGGALMVIGFVGSGDPATSCNPPAQPGINAWRSNDGGVTWQRLGQVTGLDGARLTDVAVTANGIVAVGATAPEERAKAGVWLSADGLAWRMADSPPTVENRLNAVAVRGNRVVAFADCCDDPLAWISRDGGRNWFEASLAIPVVGPEDDRYPPSVQDVAVVANGFVAVGYGCCLYPGPESVPIALVSDDGEDWLGQWLPVEHDEIMERVGVLPTGLVAVGNGTFPTGTRPDPARLGGRSWSSGDGLGWVARSPFMELGPGYVTALAAGADGVVVAGTAAGPGSLRVWYAPLNTFE